MCDFVSSAWSFGDASTLPPGYWGGSYRGNIIRSIVITITIFVFFCVYWLFFFAVPIGILPGPDKIVVKPGRQAFLHCEVYGNPRPQVSWSRNSQPIISNGHFEMFSNGTLLIRRAEETDVDSYTCVADNGVSQRASRTIKLVLRGMV